MLLCLPGGSAARPAELSYDHGRRAAGHSGGSALDSLLGKRDMRRSRQSRQPPIIHLSSMALSPSWSFRPVVVVRSFAARGGALRSDRVASLASGPPRVATCRPALATARTVWQWHSGGEREGAVQNGGSLCGHIAHTHDRSLATAIIALHSPRAPTVLGSIAARHSGCDLRHRQQTALCCVRVTADSDCSHSG